MAQISRSGDLTSGPMLQKIILFSLPLAASSILQLLFNAADVVVVGRFAGSTALAAVGSNGALINLLVNLFVGLSLGANVVAARCFGARDDQGVQNTVHTAVTLGLVSGVLLAYNLPVSIPLWQAVFGALVAMVAVKGLFGGLGKNFANPAIVARIVLFLAFSSSMTAWVYPDAVSSATPLAMMANGESVDYLTLLLGNHGGCLGETSALALLIGFAYLLIRGVISWHTPVCFVGTVFVMSLILGQDAVGQILSGGLMLGAIFMATDYSTTPSTDWGRVLFGIGAGLLTVLIRFYGAYAEGVSFAILFMNILTPYLSRWTETKPFGGVAA